MTPDAPLEPTVFVIFGGAGDLAWRKLRPALSDLSPGQSTPAHFSTIAVEGIELNQDALHGLKIAVVSNEWRELNAYRIRKFRLDGFVDFFISSCFVHLRKPDADIFRLVLDIAQAPAGQVVSIENTPMFVQVAEGLGIRSMLHTDCGTTRAKLAALGLKVAQ